jgi:hypothetical protein
MAVSVTDLNKPPVSATIGSLTIGDTFILGTKTPEPSLFMVIGMGNTLGHKDCLILGGSKDDNGTTIVLPTSQTVEVVNIHIEIKRI